MSKYVSKHYTAEEIDQRLLQGYYDDVKAAGYTGSFEQFKKSLVLSGGILNCGTVTSSSVIENGIAIARAGDPNVLFYVYRTNDGQVGIIKQIYKNDGNTIQYLTLNGVEYVRTVNYSSGMRGSWKNINKASLVYRLHYNTGTNTISFWDPIQDIAFGGVQLPLVNKDTPGLMGPSDKEKLDKLSISQGGITGTSYDLNTYTIDGVYTVYTGNNQAKNYPIQTTTDSVLKLTVTNSYNGDYRVVIQVAIVNNHIGGEGNIYLRTGMKDTWKPWAKLQTNVEVGLIDQTKMDDLTDNGIYSGILSTTGETFVIICINNYAIAQQVGVQHISHLKYSLVVGTGEVKIEKRTRDAYGFWTDWENIGSGSSSEATVDTLGGVKLGKSTEGSWLPIGNIPPKYGSGLGLKIDSSVFRMGYESNMLELQLNSDGGLNIYNGLGLIVGTTLNSQQNAIPLCMGTPANSAEFKNWTQKTPKNVPSIPVNPSQFKLGPLGLELINSSSATKVTWNANSNMNDFKTPGVYDIYGERTVKTDNLPIMNEGSGHSISARLTVVASTLQPDQVEICVTQFLQLSNRIGGEGATYVRTYNENNNGMNGWSPWQKQMGMVETLINSDYATVGQEVFSGIAQKIGDGLNNMIDNGMYSGIYIDNLSYTGTGSSYYLSAQPTFVETFVLVVINDYAASGKLNLQRHVTQLKYAVDAITGQSTVKRRVGTGNDTIYWRDWEDIGGGGSNEIELDVETILNAKGQGYNIKDLISKGSIKENITYVLKVSNSYWHAIKLFFSSKPINNYFEEGKDGSTESELKIIYRNHRNDPVLWIEGYSAAGNHHILSIKNPYEDTEVIKVSSPMTVLE